MVYKVSTDKINNNKNPNTLPKMRTVKEAADELKKLDPNTAITQYHIRHHIRQLALQGILPRVQAGKKLLINLDELISYLEDPANPKFTERKMQAQAAQMSANSGIRKIN